jgi:hypothetical protein
MDIENALNSEPESSASANIGEDDAQGDHCHGQDCH